MATPLKPIPMSHIAYCAGIASDVQGSRFVFCVPDLRKGIPRALSDGQRMTCYLLVTVVMVSQARVAKAFNVDPRQIGAAIKEIVDVREAWPEIDHSIDVAAQSIMQTLGAAV